MRTIGEALKKRLHTNPLCVRNWRNFTVRGHGLRHAPPTPHTQNMMTRWFGANWKTTVSGVLSAFFAFIVFDPELFKSLPWLVALSKFALTGGLAVLGMTAKDSNVTGGSKPNNPAPDLESIHKP